MHEPPPQDPQPRRGSGPLLVRLGFVLGIVVLSLWLDACYLTRQGLGLWQTWGGAVPLDRWEEGLSPGGSEAAFLARVKSIKDFGRTLGLPMDRNYTQFKALDRPWLVQVVQAAEEFSVDPWNWSYPLVGKLPYRGYFTLEEAEAEAARLRKKGLEVLVRPVDAFSTLGILRDPLFSFFMDYDYKRLAELLFHESTHAAFFLPGQAAFNEAVATVVGREAARQWLLGRGAEGSAAWDQAEAEQADARTFAGLMRHLAGERQAIFDRADLDADQKRRLRADHARDWFKAYRDNYGTNFKTTLYRSFGDRDDVSNAWLSLYRVYEEGSPALEQRLQQLDRSIPRFLEELATMPRNTKDPFAWLSSL